MLPTAAVRAAPRDTMDEIPDYLKVLGKWRPPARTLVAGPPPPGESEAPFIEAQASPCDPPSGDRRPGAAGSGICKTRFTAISAARTA